MKVESSTSMKAKYPYDVLLTGASGVIGHAIAHRLMNDGYSLHLTSRSIDRLKEYKAVHHYSLNLKNLSECKQVVRDFYKYAKRPYGLICNAGDLGALGAFMQTDFSEWVLGLQQNFLAHAAMIHEFLRCFKERELFGGRIVTLSGSGLGGNVVFTNVTSYSTAKAALTHLSEALAPELQPMGLMINAIAPGAVFSGITEQAIHAGDSKLGDYAATARRCKETGGVSPDLAAQLVEFLMSDQAENITGRLLSARFDQARLHQEPRLIAEHPYLYRLRRIDGELFVGKSA